MVAPILILAIGNESRGDDALAPLLLRKLDLTATQQARTELLEEFQLQVEHAMDLAERDLVLFVDAGMDTPAPYSFYRIQPGDSRTLFSHALAPEAVLATYAQIYRQAPPPAFVLCLRGEQFELGSGLSAQAAAHLEQALEFMRDLLQETTVAAWNAQGMHCTP
ncbi:MAG: hydrogenase maturation protease [Sideroxydans sp.]|nr:hydrogenase maturation protease [Sideroxydans sp.]